MIRQQGSQLPRWISVVAAFTLALLACLTGGTAAQGKAHLDQSFGDGGVARFDGIFLPQSLAEGPGGKLYALTSVDDGKGLITRILPNGKVDKSFRGTGGIYSRVVGRDLQVTSSGKVLVTGPQRKSGGNWSHICGMLEKYRANGFLAIGFGKRGLKRQCVVRVRSPREPKPFFGFYPTSIDITGQGKILVAGRTMHGGSDSGIAVARFHRNGALDRSFRGGPGTRSPQPGILEIFHQREDWGTAQEVLAIRRGKILIAARQGSVPMVIKLNANGTFDRSFGSRGSYAFRLKGYGPCECGDAIDIDIDSRGRIVLMTYLWMPGGPSHGTVVIRLHKNGHLDRRFGKRGWARPYSRKLFYPDAMAVQQDNKVVVLGDHRGPDGNGNGYALFRLNERGVLDRTFFDRGLFHPKIPFLEAAGDQSERKVIIDRRGRIVASSGWHWDPFGLVRIVPD